MEVGTAPADCWRGTGADWLRGRSALGFRHLTPEVTGARDEDPERGGLSRVRLTEQLGGARPERENMSVHYNTPTPKCPHCGHEMDTDEMCYGKPTCDVDLFALAPNEDRAVIECPACDKQYWVQGGYAPQYTSAFAEEDL